MLDLCTNVFLWPIGISRPIMFGKHIHPMMSGFLKGAGRHVTVYHMIWATEWSHCVTWYGFSEFIGPVNNIGYTMVLVIICRWLLVHWCWWLLVNRYQWLSGHCCRWLFADDYWYISANDYWSIGANDYPAIAANDSAEHSSQNKAKNMFFLKHSCSRVIVIY